MLVIIIHEKLQLNQRVNRSWSWLLGFLLLSLNPPSLFPLPVKQDIRLHDFDCVWIDHHWLPWHESVIVCYCDRVKVWNTAGLSYDNHFKTHHPSVRFKPPPSLLLLLLLSHFPWHCLISMNRITQDMNKKVPLAKRHTEQGLRRLPHHSASIWNELLVGLLFSFREYGTESKNTHTHTETFKKEAIPASTHPLLSQSLLLHSLLFLVTTIKMWG